MSYCVVIPFYNEKRFIFEVVKQSLEYSPVVIAVDDGSTDGGAELIGGMEGVEIIRLEPNSGKGNALVTGFKSALDRGFKKIITLDGDLQHPPKYIPYFLAELENYDFVIGKRKIKPGIMPISRVISNSVSSFLLSKKTGVRIIDSQSGFRGIRASLLKEIIPVEKGYIAETEMIIRAAKKQASFGWVDIPTIYGEEKSKMKNMETTLKFVSQIVKPLKDY
ncbi:MAG: glycosyltransferase family 2 protein [Ignavibacteria bacterium]|nr:glycosyltransferase family 2 protein [Ignavibacteria bacterium]